MVIAFGAQLGCVAQVLFDRTTGQTLIGATHPDEIDTIVLIDPMVTVLNEHGSRDTSETASTRKILLTAAREIIPEQITIASFTATPDMQHDLNNAIYHLLKRLVENQSSQIAPIVTDLSAILRRERIRFGMGIVHFGKSGPHVEDGFSEMRYLLIDSQTGDLAVVGWSHVHGHAPSEEPVVRYQLSRAFKKYFKSIRGKQH